MDETSIKPVIGILNKIINPDTEVVAVAGQAMIECLNTNKEEDLPDKIVQYDAVIISYSFKMSAITIDKLKNCKAIVCACVGFDNVDWKYAAKKGIRVFNVPDYGTNDVADHAFALLLAYARRILVYDDLIRKNVVGNWNARLVDNYHRLAGTKVGIVGLGRIGTAFMLRAKAFGMVPYFYDPYKESGYDRALQIKRVDDLADLFQQCKIISIHAPLTDETTGMINYEMFKCAGYCPIIVNTARGKIVKSQDAVRALKEELIEAYLADVIDEEPPRSGNAFHSFAFDPVLKNRVIITPHSASYAEESQYDMRYKSAITAVRAIQNQDYFLNCINFIK